MPGLRKRKTNARRVFTLLTIKATVDSDQACNACRTVTILPSSQTCFIPTQNCGRRRTTARIVTVEPTTTDKRASKKKLVPTCEQQSYSTQKKKLSTLSRSMYESLNITPQRPVSRKWFRNQARKLARNNKTTIKKSTPDTSRSTAK